MFQTNHVGMFRSVFQQVGAQFLLLLANSICSGVAGGGAASPWAAVLLHVQHGLQVYPLLVRLGKCILIGLHRCLIWLIVCMLACACSGRLSTCDAL